jgi:hypothetical protein
VPIGTAKSDNRYTIRTVGDSIEVQYALTSEGPAPTVGKDPASIIIAEAIKVATAAIKAAATSGAKPVAPPKGVKFGGSAALTIPTIQSQPYYPDFFETQESGAGCGRHALNNLLHNEYFVKNGAAIASGTDLTTLPIPIPLKQLCDRLSTDNPGVFGACEVDENYEESFLEAALGVIKHAANIVSVASLISGNNYSYTETNSAILGYIINKGTITIGTATNMTHWVALRKVPDGTTNSGQFVYINSTKGRPTATAYYSSLQDYLTKTQPALPRLPNIRSIIKVSNINQSINLQESLQQIREREASKASRIQKAKEALTTTIRALSIPDEYKTSLIAICKDVDTEQATELNALLSIPTISTLLNNYKDQLLSTTTIKIGEARETTGSDGKVIPVHNLYNPVVFLILYLKEIINRTDTYPKQELTPEDKYRSFYIGATDGNIILLNGKFSGEKVAESNAMTIKETTLIKIASKGDEINSLMDGTLVTSSEPGKSQFVYENMNTRTQTFIDIITRAEGGGSRRRKTLRLQARQKPGRRALSHKQVHHEQNENA